MKTPEGLEMQHELLGLTVEDFRTHPEILEEYRMGDNVHRGNFTPMLVRSFALSRGMPIIQKAFFELLQNNQHFDWKSTMKALHEAGGFDVLSEEEREYFLKAFAAVQKHTRKFMKFEFENEIRDEIERIGTDEWQDNRHQAEVGQQIIAEVSDEQSKREFSSFEEYATFLGPYIARVRES
ncbi:MAG: hypothetical protein FGM57_03480 [Candidatus Taylorbacteria bacterium]|nr:hypothetical protein [Candidatus Taylorbacteria bacterium]